MVYKAARDYGSRNSELNKKVIPFGHYKITLYQRADIANSSWFFRVYVKEEGRNYRQSLNTDDLAAAEKAVTHEMVKIIQRIGKGERLLALELKDLVRKFKLESERQVAEGKIAKTTLANHMSRINRGVEFLKTKHSRGLEVKLSEIDGTSFNDYPAWRLANNKEAGLSLRKDVIRDELLIIRKMFRIGREAAMCSDKTIPKWPDLVVEKKGPTRQRITAKQFHHLFRLTIPWIKEAHDEQSLYHRIATMQVIILAASSGMRSGEIFGLKNKDLVIRPNECVINIRGETSKVKQDRSTTVRMLALQHWFSRQKHKGENDFVFSPINKGNVSFRDTFYHQYGLLREKLREHNLDWIDLYHARHFWITTRLIAEEPIHLVAKVAGTSTKEIESTYSHVLTAITARRFNRKQVIWDDEGDYKIIEEELKKI